MLTTILPYLVEFAASTVILFIALFMMIKFQKLEYTVLGLLAASAVSIAVGMGLEFLLGLFMDGMLVVYLVHPVVCIVLIMGISKVTQAESVDVLFTVFVGYAVEFCINLFILGSLMGDLGLAHKNMADLEDPALMEDEVVATAPGKDAPQTAKEKSQPKEPSAAAKPVVAESEPKTPPIIRGKGSKAIKGLAAQFSMKGIGKTQTKTTALVHTGIKGYTIAAGETMMMETTLGNIKVSCEELTDESIVLNIAGEEVELFLY